MASRRADCAFCNIVAGSVTAAVIFEDAGSMAFLDHRPLFIGHTLLIPKAHCELLPDLPADVAGPLFTNAQILARAVEEALSADGTFIAINNRVSQSVPHLHIHVVPRRFHDGLRGFFWPRQRYADDEALRQTARSIGDAFSRLRAEPPGIDG